MRLLFLLLLLLVPRGALAASSNLFVSARDAVRLVSESNQPVAGALRLGLEFKLQPGWHIYWQYPGDAGLTPKLELAAPVTAGAPDYPPPEFLRQDGIGDYVLSGHVLLPLTAQNVAGSVTAHAVWLVCADICVPEHADFTLVLGSGASAEAGLFGPALVVPSPFAATLTPDGVLHLAGLGPDQVKEAHFFPDGAGQIVNAAAQGLGFDAVGLRLQLPLAGTGAGALAGVLELTDPSGQMQALRIAASPSAAPASHMPYWLLALLGGLLLNLMPCVFPILALKACAFARLSGAAFWGFQFQSPGFVAVLAWVMLAAALNFAGLFYFAPPGFVRRVPAQNSFFTGLLAVLVATPCTAPFMGPAIAAALVLPIFSAIGIFAALGAGLAAPVLLLALLPQLAASFPRPGVWMVWLQRVLALPMLGTFAWLAWVLFRQAGAAGLLLLLLGAGILALALWKKQVLALAVLLLLPGFHAASSGPVLSLPGAAPYSAARLAALRAAGQPVFVDLTASWCVTCLVNERSSLAVPRTQALFASHHVAVLVGDWTAKNPEITALLAASHRAGVPLYLYYPPGAAAARILPQILSPDAVSAAVGP